jgi:uncharacterized repeat protein (TIGR03803 family)
MMRVHLLVMVLATAAILAFSRVCASATTQETVLYSFGGLDGAGPLTGVVSDGSGDLFGATVFGGPRAVGTIFEASPGTAGYSESVLYTFRGREDGQKPIGIVRDAEGNLFGFGAFGGGGGGGTVFELGARRIGGYRFRLLYAFGPEFDAFGPWGAPVLGKLGALYGVTQGGGNARAGIVFKLTPAGLAYTFSTIYVFPGGTGGELPQAGLTSDSHGSVFGTTYYGGNLSGCSGGCGTVFEITPTMNAYRERILYRFQNWKDGAQPISAPAIDPVTGDIYGTTEYGGTAQVGCGTVFRLSPQGGGYVHTVLFSFDGGPNGCKPEGQIYIAPNGDLFGTAVQSGVGFGVVYELLPSHGTYTHRTVYEFLGPSHGFDDGSEPEWTNLVPDQSGALYGTTRSGGSQVQCNDGSPGCGTLFKIIP